VELNIQLAYLAATHRHPAGLGECSVTIDHGRRLADNAGEFKSDPARVAALRLTIASARSARNCATSFGTIAQLLAAIPLLHGDQMLRNGFSRCSALDNYYLTSQTRRDGQAAPPLGLSPRISQPAHAQSDQHDFRAALGPARRWLEVLRTAQTRRPQIPQWRATLRQPYAISAGHERPDDFRQCAFAHRTGTSPFADDSIRLHNDAGAAGEPEVSSNAQH